MARRQIVPDILAILSPWLDKIQTAYDAQPAGNRMPTLPVLPEGKINVVGVVRELNLPAADQKYFHTKPEIRDLVNSFAEAQGVRGIGSRTALDQVDEVVREKFKKLSSAKRDTDNELTEALQRIEDLTAENQRLRVQRDRFQAALREIYATGDLPSPVAEALIHET
jgi:FtsZ-binding cell division protein ZapB